MAEAVDSYFKVQRGVRPEGARRITKHRRQDGGCPCEGTDAIIYVTCFVTEANFLALTTL